MAELVAVRGRVMRVPARGGNVVRRGSRVRLGFRLLAFPCFCLVSVISLSPVSVFGFAYET